MVGGKIGLKNNTFSIPLINYPSSFKKNKLSIFFLSFFYLFVAIAMMTITNKICICLYFFLLASPTTPRPTTTPTTPGMKQISTTTSPLRNMHLLYEKCFFFFWKAPMDHWEVAQYKFIIIIIIVFFFSEMYSRDTD